MLKRLLLSLIGVLLIFSVAFWPKIFEKGHTSEIKSDNGAELPNSIALLERVTLGGLSQSVLIRGHDRHNPILLWLHGGPGSSQMPIAHQYDKGLEKEFVVVHWDQRGAGKSNPRDFDESTMSYEQFISDGYELTQYLKARFGKEKIFLLGHSWGTQFGLELANRYPKDYYAYIGVSQVVGNEKSSLVAYEWLGQEMEKGRDSKGIEKLRMLGAPPYSDHSSYVTFAQMIDSYGGSFDVDFKRLLWISLQAPEYTFKDYWAWLKGASRGSGPMWHDNDYQTFDAIERFSQIDVPVYFLSGQKDYNTPLVAVQQFYDSLSAPRGKKLVVFEESAHTPFLAEPDKFILELVRIKEEVL